MSAPRYRFTFGMYNQKEAWTDRRSLTWPEVARLLTSHELGPKAGTCIVPAVFSSTERKQGDATSIDVVMLDSDGGATLDEIRTVIARQRWSAVISSTHSHLTIATRVKRSNWEAYCRKSGGADVAAFLVAEKGYLPRVAAGARIGHEEGEFLWLEHAPCPKFRIAIPLRQPWLAASYPNAKEATSAWRGAVGALAHALGLHHDQACTDANRLFYLPRRPPSGPEPEVAVLDGEPCDIFALPMPPTREQPGRHPQAPQDRTEYTHPETGEVVDLRAWGREHGKRFLIVAAVKARRPDVLTGHVADGVRHHIRCPNEDEHTQAGEDAATFIADPGTCPDAKGFVIHCRHAHCDGRDRLFFLRRMLEQKWLAVADLTDQRLLGNDEENRPTIRYTQGELAEIVDQAERALIRADLNLYQRGTAIVRPAEVRIAVTAGREVCARRIVEVREHSIIEAMTAAAVWEKQDGRSNNWVRIDAPLKVAATYLQRVGSWKLPTLTALIEAPTLRPDGSILSSPGYDAATGLLLETGSTRFPTVPSNPSKEDAQRALQALSDLIATFPFVDEASRSVALSAILTASIRRALRTAPMHAFTAPTAGSGKSKLVDLTSVIASGREAGIIAQGKSEEELEKRLGALLLAGDPVIAIDNCEAPLGGEFLCSMLTQRAIRPRILGRSETPELPTNVFVTATGNNLILLGDMTRRAVVCRLDPEAERPELRQFDRDPVAEALQRREHYLTSCLRAHPGSSDSR